MLYAELDDILAQLRQDVLLHLIDDENQGLDVDDTLRPEQEARVNKSISDATAECDAYVGQRYALPLAGVPTILNKCCVDIAIYNLFPRNQPPDDIIIERYENAIRMLKDISAGRAALPVEALGGGSAGTVDAGASGTAKISSKPRVFDRDKLGGY